jgi:glucokinase
MSASGMVAAARAAGLEAAGTKDIFAAAASGHVLAGELITQMIDRLAATIAVAAHALNPEVIVLGGGVANAGEPLRLALLHALPRYVMPSHRDGLRIVLAELGEWAGAIGAGLLSMESGVTDQLRPDTG